jgi:hypothetical protein
MTYSDLPYSTLKQLGLGTALNPTAMPQASFDGRLLIDLVKTASD